MNQHAPGQEVLIEHADGTTRFGTVTRVSSKGKLVMVKVCGKISTKVSRLPMRFLFRADRGGHFNRQVGLITQVTKMRTISD